MSYGDLILNELEFPLFPETFPADPPDLLLPPNEIVSLTAQVERMNIDIHTQSLRIEVERVKKQKLRARLKRIKREDLPTNRILSQVRHDMAVMQEQVSTI